MLAFLIAFAMIQSDKPDTGAKLYDSCRASVRLLETDNPSDDDNQASQYCSGYLHGVTEALAVANVKPFCIPDNATYGTAIRLYVEYMAKNPKNMDDIPIVGLILSLKNSYPCAVKKK